MNERLGDNWGRDALGWDDSDWEDTTRDDFELDLTSKASGKSETPYPAVRRVQRIMEYAQKVGGPNRDGTKRTINELLDNVAPRDVSEILRQVNSRLTRNMSVRKSPVVGDDFARTTVELGWLKNKFGVAPERDLQKDLFLEYLGAIKALDDKEKRALLAYYGINMLHLFLDGNGRTSRAAYLLLLNDATLGSEGDKEYGKMVEILTHEGLGQENGAGEEEFLRRYGIRSIEDVSVVGDILLQEKLVNEGRLDSNLAKTLIFVDLACISDYDFLMKPFVSRKNREGLTDKEIRDVEYAFSDGVPNGDCSTLAGLTMAIMLQEKGTLEKNMKSIENGKLIFNVEDVASGSSSSLRGGGVKGGNSLFDGWDPEDYKRLAQIYKMLKKEQNEMLMSIFTDDLSFCDGWSIADWAMKKYEFRDIVIPKGQDDSLLTKFVKKYT